MTQSPSYLAELMKIPYIRVLLFRLFGIGRMADVQLLKYSPSRRSSIDARRGLSLIEIMIALTMTLIVLGAMMTAFQSVSRQMQSGRAMIELASRIRNIETSLRSDLGNLTVEPRPYTTTIPPGHLEIVEGPRNDSTMTATVSNVVGDIDDTLSMTVQSKGRLFRGRANGQIIESPIAEVVWFPVWNELGNIGITDYEDSFELRRRVLLIRPDIVLPTPTLPATDWSWDEVVSFFQNNDLSVRIEPSLTNVNRFNLVPNQLADLSIRKNRFGHLPAHAVGNQGAFLTWPAASNVPVFNGPVNPRTNEIGFPNQMHYSMLAVLSRRDDVVLTDLTAFDVRVFSPNAAVLLDQPVLPNPNAANMVLEPGDFAGNFVTLPVSSSHANLHGDLGAFVDLGFIDLRARVATDRPAWFSGQPTSVLGLWPNHTWPPGTLREYVFDTWAPVYESDGIDQDRSGVADQGTDGLDSNNQNGVDDIGERETRPPYNYPIRGIEIRLRTVEKTTKQVHQTTILHSFVPE